MKTIPVMFCFDKNYVIPASVAFYSLMEHANKKYKYIFYVLHTDITEEQQKKLLLTVKEFENNCEIVFMNMNNRFDDVWKKIKSKVHFSKEVLYKILVGSIFPQYERIIVSDVDVVFLRDISESYFINNIDNCYLAGIKQVGYLRRFNVNYFGKFSNKEIRLLNGFCGGYIVFNLKKIREDKFENKCVNFLDANADRLIYAEQDVLNICCDGNVRFLPLNYVTCTYMWDFYNDEVYLNNDGNYTKEEILDAMNNPIQLHYASTEKPWKYVDTTKSEEWFKYIVKTPFLKDYLKGLPDSIINRNIQVSSKKSLLKRIISRLRKLFFGRGN